MAGTGDAREQLAALWARIEHAHYSYLQTDDSPDKLRQRRKLEGYILEYLSLVPHECKFGLQETGKVFERTIRELPDYSAYRAGLGWAALERYAANLIAQPWRKEYKTIRLYCGYYKHEIEANMVGAETILHTIGYEPAPASRLVLRPPICPDTLAAMSRDAIIAQMECQIMTHVWEVVWKGGGSTTWSDVARVRATQIGSAQDAAHRLLLGDSGDLPYIDGTEIYENLEPSVSDPNRIDPRCIPSSSHTYVESPIEDPIVPTVQQTYPYAVPNAIPPHMMYPVPHHHHDIEVPSTVQPVHMMTHPVPHHHHHIDVPNTVHPVHTMTHPVPHHHHHMDVPNTVPPVHMMTPYGVPFYYPPPYMVPTPVYAAIKHANNIPINGYPQHRCPAVPTGQLIELDPSYESSRRENRHKKRPESSRRVSTSRSEFSEVSIPSIPRSDTQPALSKASEDGMGTYESWDYVFRNLSSKDEGDRNRFSPSVDRDSRTLDRLDKDERRMKYLPTTLDLEDGLQALNLDRSYDEDAYRTAKVNENLIRLKQEQELKRAKQKKAEVKKKLESVPNPTSDGLVPQKVAPDKVKLLSKKDIQDRKEVLKQQNGAKRTSGVSGANRASGVSGASGLSEANRASELSGASGSSGMSVAGRVSGASLVNGANRAVPSAADARKLKKPAKLLAPETEKRRPVENGHGAGLGSRSSATSVSPQNYDPKTQLIVSLDEPDSRTNGDRPASRNSSQASKWECATCTYLNNPGLQVCEMCGKSKKGTEIEPLTSGGKECSACTLVNQRGARVCDACGTRLEDCPTYI